MLPYEIEIERAVSSSQEFVSLNQTEEDLFAAINNNTYNMSSNTNEVLLSRGHTPRKTTTISTRGDCTNVSVDKHSCCKKQSKYLIFLFKLVSFLNITLPDICCKDTLSQCTNYAGEIYQKTVCSGIPKSFLSSCYSLMKDKTLISSIPNPINSCDDFETDTFLSILSSFNLKGEIRENSRSRYIPSLDQISELINTSVKNPIILFIQTAEARSISYLECYHPSTISLEISECDSGQKRERSESHKSNSTKGNSSKRQRQSHSTSDALVSSSNSSGSGDDERDNNGKDRQRIPHSATPTVAKARKQKGKRARKRGKKHRKKSSKVKRRRSSRAGQRCSRTHDLQVSLDIFFQKERRHSHCKNPRNPIRLIRRHVSSPEPTDYEGDFSVTTKWSESCKVPLDCSLVPSNVMMPLKQPIVVSREMPQIRMDPPSVLGIAPSVKTNLDSDLNLTKYSRNVSAVFHVNRNPATIVPGVGDQIKQNDHNKHERSSKLVSGVSYADKVKIKNCNGDTSSSNNPAQQVCVQTIPSAHVRKKGETDAPLGDALQDYTGGAHAIGEDTLNQTDCTPPDSTASNVAITLQQHNSKAIISQFVPSIVEYSSPVGTLVSQFLSGQSSDASEASTDTDIMTHQNRPPVQEPPDNTAPLGSQSMVVLPLRHQPSEIEASALQVIPLSSCPYEESQSRNRTKLFTRQHSLTQTHTFENNSLGRNEQDYDHQAPLAIGNDQIQIHGSPSWTQSVQESERDPVQNFCIVLPTSEWHFRPPHAQIVDGINQEELGLSPVQSQPEVTGIAQHLGSSDYRSFSALVEILPFEQPQTILAGMYYTVLQFVGFYASHANCVRFGQFCCL